MARLIHKWNTHHFLSEPDRHKLLVNLNIMRMVCDSTYILDQKTRYDVKIDETMNIVSDILQGTDSKVVIFSQWERMTRLLAQELDKHDIDYEYLHGGVTAVKRGEMMQRFQNNADCRVFISTDAGSTGLNLQTASFIINLDLPWNPAVLEQRIGRIYRLGQQRNIQVINLVAAGTIEERMIGKLRFKQNMFEGVLDNGDDTIFVGDDKFKDIVNLFDGIIEKEDDNVAAIDSDEMETTTEQPLTPSEEVQETDDNFDEPSLSDNGDASNNADNEETTEKPAPSSGPTDSPHDLVAQGVSFFSGLAKTLQSPEATQRLVDTIVKTDETTGETSINIPVASKESVQQVLSLISKLFVQH